MRRGTTYPRRPRRGASERAPTRPGARCTRATRGAGRPNGPRHAGPDVGRGARPARPPGSAFGCRTPRARGGPPRTSAPTTRLSDTPRTGRAAEDVGPYHRSALGAGRPNGPRHGPARDVPAPPRRGASERAPTRPCARCTRAASARGVRTGPPRTSAPTTARLSDNPRTGRAAEDVGPYHSAGGQPAPGAARGTVGRFFAIIPA